MKERYPELLAKAEDMRDHLTELQESVMELLPDAIDILPEEENCYDILINDDTQANIQGGIVLHALYKFADIAYNQLRERCDTLAMAINGDNNVSERDAYNDVETLLEKLNVVYNQHGLAMPENIGVAGMIRLLSISNYMGHEYGLYDYAVVGSFKLRVIMEYISLTGYFGVILLSALINEPIPTDTTIGDIADDDTTVSIN